MTDYTPTTEGVREEWAYGNQEVDLDGNPVITLDEAFAQFDRWLAAHDRKIAAEAWDEGYWQGINGHTGPGNPYRDHDGPGPHRADRIEQGGQE